MKKKILIIVVLSIAVAVGFTALRRPHKDSGGLKISGTIEVTTVELSFKISGRLLERLLDEGNNVKAGQVVAKLEETELRQERDARSADLRSLESAVADLEAGSRREEIGKGEASLNRMKAEADRFAADFRRSEELFAREVIPRKEYDATKAAKESSAAAVKEAEEQLQLLKSGPRPDAVKQARAKKDAAKAAVALSETRVSQAVLTSTVTGLVLAKHVEPGEMLIPAAPVLTVGKMDEVWVKGYIPETELGRVKVGQSADVTSDSWPGKIYAGKISFISPQAEFTPKNVQTEKERVKLVYRIKITIPNPDMELKPGMPVDAVIQTGAARS